MIINPKKSRKKNGLFWVGQEGEFRLHLYRDYGFEKPSIYAGFKQICLARGSDLATFDTY